MNSLPEEICTQIIVQAMLECDLATVQSMRGTCTWMRDAFDAANRRLVLGGRLPFPPWEEGPETSLPGFTTSLPFLLARTPNLEDLEVTLWSTPWCMHVPQTGRT